MNSKIPKRIIQVWGGSLDLPIFSKASAANVKLLNPKFEYVFFDDESMDAFVNEHFPEYRSMFDLFRFPIQRFDLFRYLAIYKLGGFYFDMDVFLASDLSELLDFECVFPFEELTVNRFLRKEYGMDWEVGNYAFGAAPGHPFILAIIENCIRAKNNREWTQIMMKSIPKIFSDEFFVYYTTGPGLVSRTLAEYKDASKQVKILFPENVCDINNWSLFGKYGIHLSKGSWRKRKNFLRSRLFGAWMSWERKNVLKEAIKLGKTRSLDFKLKI